MENALKTQPLTAELLKEAKRIEFPDTVISRLTGKSADEIKQMRYDNNIVAAYKMVDTCAAEFEAETPYIIQYTVEKMKQLKQNHRRRFLFWVQVQSVLDRVLNLTSVQFIVHGHLKKRVMKQLL